MKPDQALQSFVRRLLTFFKARRDAMSIGRFLGGILCSFLVLGVCIRYFPDFGFPEIGIDDGTTVRLVGTRGEKMTFYIRGTSVGGHWASSTGLSWIGEDNISRLIIPPREKYWTDSITVTGTMPRFSIPVSIVVPSLPQADQHTISGKIVGNLELPMSSERGFVNIQKPVDIPVVIEIVSAEVAKQLAKQKAETGKPYLLFALSVIIGCLFLVSLLPTSARHY